MTQEKRSATPGAGKLSGSKRSGLATRIFILPLPLVVFLSASLVSKAQIPPGVIVFTHEDSGSPDPSQRFYNLWWLDPQNSAQQVQITNFTVPPLLATTAIWSKDFSRLAFTSNFNNGLSSLEETSIYSINFDGSNVQQITGFGVLDPLPPPTGTIVGRVQATGGPLNGCVASVQGAPQNVDCSDGTFQITDVPLSSAWVRVQGFVVGPGLELGFSAISVTPDVVTDVGTITIYPQLPKSIEPSWSRDGSQLIMTNEVNGRRLIGGTWTPFSTHELTVWSADGQFVRSIPNPTGLEAFGSDWSPVADQIAFAAAGLSAGQSYVVVANSDGTNPQSVYQVPISFDALRFVTFCRWSPDGLRIVFVQLAFPTFGSSWSDLLVINADGSGLQPLTDNHQYGGFTEVPTWSPDAQALAFEFDLGTDLLHIQSTDLWGIYADASAVFRLTNDGRSSSPTWGPPM